MYEKFLKKVVRNKILMALTAITKLIKGGVF